MPITPPSARTLTSTPVPPRGRRGTRFPSPIAPRASSPSPATERAPIALTNSRLFMIPSSDRRVVDVPYRLGFRPPALPCPGLEDDGELGIADRHERPPGE